MRRAVAQQKTTDIDVIVRRYESRSFGFASRNFYTAFLAAVDVDAAPEKYFGPLSINAPDDTIVVQLPDYMSPRTIATAFLVDETTLRELNPALTAVVWSGDKYVPRGFELRLPRGIGEPGQLLASIPSSERFAAQSPDVYHRVRRGDTLSQIASQYRVSLAALMETNNLRSRDIIRAGQTLTLPVNQATLAAAAREQREAEAAVATVAVAATAPNGNAGVYVVEPGDSIERIARKLGVDEEILLAENGIRNRNRIQVGQELRVSAPIAVAAAVMTVPAVDAPPAVSASDASLAGVAEVGETVPAVEENLTVAESDMAVSEACPFAALYCRDAMVAAALTPAGESVETAGEEITQDPTTALDANVLASVQDELAADPSDYTVAADYTIEVQALETLGHYADWLELRTQRLRDVNGMPFSRAVVIGQRVKLDFSRVDPAEFERRRTAYQQSMQEAFFRSYQIVDIEDHVVRPGESLWVLAQRRYGVPVWLLRQYNPDLQLDNVMPGAVVKFPQLKVIIPAEAPEGVSA
jgi:membrane-bound lytic murein transglycosylase D